MLLRLVRHATLLVEVAGIRLIIDPMLGPAGGQPPIPETPNPRPNPLVDLPVPAESTLVGVRAALITHLHQDHIDVDALRLMPPDLPVYCQPTDVPMLARLHPSELHPVATAVTIDRLTVTRTGGRHGQGVIADEMGPVSGFVIAAEGEPTLYVAGDTVWCDDMAAAIATHTPDVIVVNAGAARFVAGEPITMDVPDVVAVCRAAPEALVVAVHMEAINHCLLTRADLRAALATEDLADRVAIPADGETLSLSFS